MLISRSDKQIIRDCAKIQLEMACTVEMAELKKEWVRHNDCKIGRPMITIEWGTFESEAIIPLLKCKGKIARAVEKQILGNYAGKMLFNDDSVVTDYVGMPKYSSFNPFNIPIEVQHLDNSVGHHFNEVIKDLGEDFHLLKPSKFGINKVSSYFSKNFVEGLVGDILPVKYVGKSLYSVPTQDIVHIMSLENLMFSMYDYPDEFHKTMKMLTDDYISYFKYLENKKFLLTTNGAEWVGQGSYAYTSDLPSEKDLGNKNVTTKDIWGFMDSQETSTISPDMYEEFIFPYYKKVADIFGLVSYGCCEPIDPIWENCISKLENLRKVSISAWCNEEYMGEQLSGKKIVYHRKPSANFLGVDKVLDKDAFSKYIQKTVDATKGCTVEFTQRDVYTVHNDMQKVRDYVNIIRNLTK